MSPAIADWLGSVEVVAPVVLVDSLVTPIVLEGEVVDGARDGSVELLGVLVESGVEVAVLEVGADDTPYVELVPDDEVELGLVEVELVP
jgi:hypothetical protein